MPATCQRPASREGQCFGLSNRTCQILKTYVSGGLTGSQRDGVRRFLRGSLAAQAYARGLQQTERCGTAANQARRTPRLRRGHAAAVLAGMLLVLAGAALALCFHRIAVGQAEAGPAPRTAAEEPAMRTVLAPLATTRAADWSVETKPTESPSFTQQTLANAEDREPRRLVVPAQPAPPAPPAPVEKAAARPAVTAPTMEPLAPQPAQPPQTSAPLPAVSSGPLDAPALARLIDGEIQKRLDAENVLPSPQADDAEFLRRVHLDIAGVLPTAEKAAAFADSKDPARRAREIDELLASPQYVRRMTAMWTMLLIPNSAASLRRNHEGMIVWLEQAFAANKPWDKLAAEVVAADLAGGTFKDPAHGQALFYLTHESADQVTDRFSRVFLGVRLQCAQCHNDRSDSNWKQTEYWSLAAFFKFGHLKLPPSALTASPAFLRDPQAPAPAADASRTALAAWLTKPGNRYFARAMVNRVWHQFFGRGLVNPVDDLHEDNEASHPELLQLLERQFTVNGFDLHHLIRAICNSQTYQRTSRPAGGNAADKTLYSHMTIKVLSPLQLQDSLELVYLGGARKPEKKGNRRFLGSDQEPDPTEYDAGIPQVLRLMNSEQTNRFGTALTELSRQPPAPVINRLFLATLSRRPTPAELRKFSAYAGQQTDLKRAYTDILWALVNSTEFITNH